MKKVKRKEYSVNNLAVAFAIPFFGMLLVMLAGIGLVILITDYMFVGTLLAAVCYWVWFLVAGRDVVVLIVMFVLEALVFFKHRANFAGLMAGKELGMRASFAKKKNPGENRDA